MIPAVFARLHRTRQTPWVANLALMLLTGALAAFTPVAALSKLTSIGTLLAFAIVCGGVLVLRWREPERERPFRVPGSPVTPGARHPDMRAADGVAAGFDVAAAAGVVRLGRGGLFRL